jgi:hypothetical protein
MKELTLIGAPLRSQVIYSCGIDLNRFSFYNFYIVQVGTTDRFFDIQKFNVDQNNIL